MNKMNVMMKMMEKLARGCGGDGVGRIENDDDENIFGIVSLWEGGGGGGGGGGGDALDHRVASKQEGNVHVVKDSDDTSSNLDSSCYLTLYLPDGKRRILAADSAAVARAWTHAIAVAAERAAQRASRHAVGSETLARAVFGRAKLRLGEHVDDRKSMVFTFDVRETSLLWSRANDDDDAATTISNKRRKFYVYGRIALAGCSIARVGGASSLAFSLSLSRAGVRLRLALADFGRTDDAAALATAFFSHVQKAIRRANVHQGIGFSLSTWVGKVSSRRERWLDRVRLRKKTGTATSTSSSSPPPPPPPSSSSSSSSAPVALVDQERQDATTKRVNRVRHTIILEQGLDHSLFDDDAVARQHASGNVNDKYEYMIRDMYGFRVAAEYLDLYESFAVGFLARVREQSLAFDAFFANPTTTTTTSVTELVARGIPPRFRGQVWVMLAGVDHRMKMRRGYYASLVQRHHRAEEERRAGAAEAEAAASDEATEDPSVLQIDLDIGRTFPGLHDDETFRSSLRRVLIAFALHNETIGYTQSMNFLAGILRLFCSEEASFYMLAFIVEELMPFAFHDSLVGNFSDLALLRTLMARETPSLLRHFDRIEFDLAFFGTPWFMCLFVISLPSETALRVWDRIFCEGASVVFTVALQILRLAESELLAIRDPFDALVHLNHMTNSLFDADEIFNVKLRAPVLDEAELKVLRYYFLEKASQN